MDKPSDAIRSEAERADLPKGHIRWHCSKEDGGPDVGVELSLGEHDTLYMGEISRRFCEEHGLADDHGWWLVHYRKDGAWPLARIADDIAARETFDLLAAALLEPAQALARAEARGAERMREAAAKIFEPTKHLTHDWLRAWHVRLAAAIRALPLPAEACGAERTWQPISAAPKDGSWFVIVRAGEEDPIFEAGRYSPHYWPEYVPVGDGLFRQEQRVLGEWQHFNNFHRATHWQPLPPPPLPAEEPQPGHEREGGAGERNRRNFGPNEVSRDAD